MPGNQISQDIQNYVETWDTVKMTETKTLWIHRYQDTLQLYTVTQPPDHAKSSQFQYKSWPWADVSSGSSCVEMRRSRSLADKKMARQIRLSSRCCRCRQIVRSRTGWESTSAQLNLSTQNHVQYVRPAAGGNARSPTHDKTRQSQIADYAPRVQHMTYIADHYH